MARYREMVQPVKGYGFIKPSDGSSDVSVHISAVERAVWVRLEGRRSVMTSPPSAARRQR